MQKVSNVEQANNTGGTNVRKVNNWLKQRWFLSSWVLALVLLVTLVGVPALDSGKRSTGMLTLGGAEETVITLGHVAEAAGAVDYTYDGVDDNIQFQAALDALPATGGRLVDVSAVNKSFTAVVSRAIDNVTIEGSGAGSYFANNGVASIFSAGGQSNWYFINFSTDAGGVDITTATNSSLENVTIGATFWAYDTTIDVGGASWDIPTGRGATLIVAASDSYPNSAAQADYVCDGTADEVQINAAINALPATGGRIMLSEGTFTIASPILIVAGKRVIAIEGQGRVGGAPAYAATTIALANNSDCDVIRTNDTPGYPYYAVVLKDFIIDGNKANQANGHGINCNYFNLFAENVSVRDAKQNGWESWTTTQYGRFYECEGRACDGWGWQIRVQGIHMVHCGAFSNAYGMYLLGGDDCIVIAWAETNADAGLVIRVGDSILDLWAASNGIEGINLGESGGNNVVRLHAKSNNQGVPVNNAEVVLYGTANNVITGIAEATVAGMDAICLLGQDCSNTRFRGRFVGTRYGVRVGAGGAPVYTGVTFSNSEIYGGTAPVSLGAFADQFIFDDNTGYIAPGEVRTASGSLTAGVANDIGFAWHNLEAQDILIKKVVIETTTAGGVGGSHLDVGIADDAAGTNRGVEFFDDLLLNTTIVHDSWAAGDGGTQTKYVFCQDSASGTDGWIVGQILDANAGALVGEWYIEYVGR